MTCWFPNGAWLVFQAASALWQAGAVPAEKTADTATAGPRQATWCWKLGRVKVEYHPSDTDRRVWELPNVSEDLRQIEQEWERFNGPQPPGVFVERVHGGIQ